MSSSAVAPDLRYPVGQFKREPAYSDAQRAALIQDLAELPAKLRAAVAGLSDQQLDTPYRDGGWTVRQVVHHVADSHLHSYARFRLALTESKPAIKPYDEAAWAELPDAKHEPVEVSLKLLEGLHQRWVVLLNCFENDDWKRSFVHPERGEVDLLTNLALYSWHSKHHVAHVTELRKRKGW